MSAAKMEVRIKNPRLREIWNCLWIPLSQDDQQALQNWVMEVKDDVSACPDIDLGCGTYSSSCRSIKLYGGDLSPLSHSAVVWVVAHELRHAYCHLKYGNPAPCGQIDDCANFLAFSWGFQREHQQFESEKEASENG